MWFIAFFSLLTAYGYSERSDLLTEIRSNRETLSSILLSEPEMQTITTTWTDQNGNTRSVTTTQREGEDWADTLLRHQADVTAAQQVFPPAR